MPTVTRSRPASYQQCGTGVCLEFPPTLWRRCLACSVLHACLTNIIETPVAAAWIDVKSSGKLLGSAEQPLAGRGPE